MKINSINKKNCIHLCVIDNLGYSRVEVAANVRRRAMKLWFSTAIGPQQSRCSEIGSSEGEKMPT